MAGKLVEIKKQVSDKLCSLRSILHTIDSEIFQDSFDSHPEEQEVILGYIKNADRESLDKWLLLKKKKGKDLYEMGVRELRKLAIEYGLSGYHKMTKLALISALESSRKSRK